MAIAFIQAITPYNGSSPQVSGAYTGTASATAMAAFIDTATTNTWGSGLSIAGSGSNPSSWTNLGTTTLLSNATSSCAYALSEVAGSQTVTITSTGSGSIGGYPIEYSGVSTATFNAPTEIAAPGASNPYLGTSISVPTGSVLVVLCRSLTSSTIPTANGANATRLSYNGGGGANGACWADWLGAGSNIQPSFNSSASNADTMVMFYFLLNPPAAAGATIAWVT